MDGPKSKSIKSGKAVFKVDSPYTAVKWPHLGATEHDVIVDMLVRLLSPIGRHRNLHVVPSKGKRSKKRKRTEQTQPAPPVPAPPVPEIARHITVGLNSTTRHLEQLASATAPQAVKSDDGSAESKEPTPPTSRMTAVFLPSSTTALIYAHLPLLCSTASATPPSATSKPDPASSTPSPSPTRLIPLRPATDAKLAAALGISRLGVVGLLESAPGAETLVKYIRDHVEPVDVPWMREAMDGKYLNVNIRTEGT